MGIRDSSGSGFVVNVINAVIRFGQLIVAAAVLGVYAGQVGYWVDHGIPSKIDLALATASLSLLTALAFGIIPFFLSYHPVALAFAWDWILFFLWSATFGLMKSIFYAGNQDRFFYHHTQDDKLYADNWNKMLKGVWINLAGMILFLASAIMGLVLFFLGRRTSRSSKPSYA